MSAVDEERRRPTDSAPLSASKIFADAPRMPMSPHVVFEPGSVETDSDGVLDQVPIVEGTLMLEQHVVHLPEPALARRALGGLCRMLRVRMAFRQREVPEHESQAGTEPALDFFDDRVRLAAGGALVVAVLDQRDSSARGSFHVIAWSDRRRQLGARGHEVRLRRPDYTPALRSSR